MRNDIGPAINTIGGWIRQWSRVIASLFFLCLIILVILFLTGERTYATLSSDNGSIGTTMWQMGAMLVGALLVGRILGGIVQIAGLSLMTLDAKREIIRTADEHGVLIQDVMDALKEKRKAERREKFSDVW